MTYSTVLYVVVYCTVQTTRESEEASRWELEPSEDRSGSNFKYCSSTYYYSTVVQYVVVWLL